MMAGATAPPPQKVRHNLAPRPLAYTSGGGDTVDIKGGYYLRYVLLQLNFVMASGSNLAIATLKPGSEWGVVKRLKITAGSETLIDMTGEELRVYQSFRQEQFPRPFVPLGATSTTVQSTLILPLSDPMIRKPIDTSINTNRYGNLRYEVTWGTHTDVSSDATSFTTAPTIEISQQTSTGYMQRVPGTNKFQNGQTFERRMLRKTFTTAAVGTNRIDLVTGLVAYRSLLVYAKTNAGLDDPGKISYVRLKSLTTTLLESSFAALRDNQIARSGLRDQISSGGAKFNPMQETSFSFDNYLFLDFAQDGLLSEAMPTFRINDLYLEITCPSSAPNQIIVVGDCLIPPNQ